MIICDPGGAGAGSGSGEVIRVYSSFRLTTQHPASLLGIPVLVDEDGVGYGPHECMPWGERAAEFVLRLWTWGEGEDSLEVMRFLAAGGISPTAIRPNIS